ncbi:SLAM family member 6-like isoform X2 [Sardina pilchardus]|uniref:SLAM family member 6-like isoform X2 n=1 Tax=Sardina pilchardus TaxID=27697 RepID=UPI002E0E4FD2
MTISGNVSKDAHEDLDLVGELVNLCLCEKKMSVPIVLLLLVYTLQTAGSPRSFVGQTGGSVTLEFQQHQQLEGNNIDFVQWYFGKEKIIKYMPHKDTLTVFTHEGRLEFNKKTLSLELKNLQTSDTGLYKVEISAEKADVQSEFRLLVLDPVEAPILSVHNQSCDYSNVTVTCRGHNLSLNSICNNTICSPERKASTDFTLSLSVKDNSITCTHSRNLAGFKTAKMELSMQCHLSSACN